MIEEPSLLTKIKEGDKIAFKELFIQNHPVLFRFTVSRVRDSEVAEDIVQETFIRVWKIRKSLNPEKSFFSLIARIAGNLCLDHFRHQAVRLRHKEAIVKTVDTPGESPADLMEISHLEEQLMEGIHTYLPEKCRNIFILSRFEGYSAQEVADQLGLSRRTVENQLYRALKILRKKLSHFFE